jgi:hypothetical protein
VLGSSWDDVTIRFEVTRARQQLVVLEMHLFFQRSARGVDRSPRILGALPLDRVGKRTDATEVLVPPRVPFA